MRSLVARFGLLACLFVLAGCADGNPFAQGIPIITVTLGPNSGTVSVGTDLEVIARSTSSQPGQPTFDLVGLPAGVTFTANPPAQVTPLIYTWTVTISADGSAVAGTTAITFTSSRSAGGQGSAEFSLTVS